MIYYSIFIILFMLAFTTDVFKTKQITPFEKLLFIISSICLIVFVGFRTETGYDFETYKRLFNTISEMKFPQLFDSGWGLVIEPAYMILNYVLKWMEFHQFILILAILSIVPKVVYIYKYCEKKMICLFLYFSMYMCGFDMGVMRQGIAMGICLWAYQAFAEEKYKRFIGLTIFASLFHSSSLVLLLLFIVGKRKFSTKFYIGTIIITFCFSQLHIISFIAERMPIAFIQNKLWYYLYSSEVQFEGSILLSALKRFLVFIIFIIVIDWERVKQNSEKNDIIYLNVFYLSIVVSLLLSEIPILGGRGTTVFQMAQIFIFSFLFNGKYYRNIISNNLLYRFLCGSFTVIWAFYNLYSLINTHDYLPYTFQFVI